MCYLTPNYINSYWATEHGGMVLSHPYGNAVFPLIADASTTPLPWIFPLVYLGLTEEHEQGLTACVADQIGELMISEPWPYMARTCWGDPENYTRLDWVGDRDRFTSTYFVHQAGSEMLFRIGDKASH